MEEAAEKLEISRSTLYNKLDSKNIEPEFVQLIQDRLGINVQNPERSSNAIGIPERIIEGKVMKYHTVPLKEKRVAELWLPSDFGKADIKTLKQWLDFVESTL